MSLKDDVESIKSKIGLQTDDEVLKADALELQSHIKASKKVKPKKLPFKFRSRRHFKNGKVLVVWLGSNHNLEFKWGTISGGLIKVLANDEVNSYKAYEEGAIYFHKKYPVCVIFEWRLTPIGGKAEVYKSQAVGGDFDKALAEKLGLSAAAEQTIIRAIKAEEIDKGDDKKKRKIPVAILLIGGALLLFVIGKATGVI